MDFMSFRKAVATRFATLCSFPLYRTGVSGDEMWKTYLESFPEGTNPIFRKRRELSANRKVFEMVGSKMQVDETSNGLYGIGFTKGRNDTLVVRVDGKQCYTVQF